jgi:hypothetical protein
MILSKKNRLEKENGTSNNENEIFKLFYETTNRIICVYVTKSNIKLRNQSQYLPITNVLLYIPYNILPDVAFLIAFSYLGYDGYLQFFYYHF